MHAHHCACMRAACLSAHNAQGLSASWLYSEARLSKTQLCVCCRKTPGLLYRLAFVGVCSPRLQHPVSGSSGCSCSRLFSWRHCSFWRRKPTQCPTKGPHSIENFTFLLTSRDFLTGMEEVLHLECRLAAIKQFIFTQCMKSSVLPADCKLPSWFPAAPTIVSDTRLCRFALCMLPAK